MADKPEAKPGLVIAWTERDRKPPQSINIGIHPTIALPDEETQRAGFYHDDARLILTNVDGYKRKVEKG